MKHLLSRLFVSAALVALVPALPAQAATPPGIFVVATQLGEFTTLDPSGIYELVPSEYVANTYERLVRVDLKDPTRFDGQIAQSWTVGADGVTYTFAAPRPHVPLRQPGDRRRRRVVAAAHHPARQGTGRRARRSRPHEGERDAEGARGRSADRRARNRPQVRAELRAQRAERVPGIGLRQEAAAVASARQRFRQRLAADQRRGPARTSSSSGRPTRPSCCSVSRSTARRTR